MAKLAVVVAMLLVQVQPLAGVVLCQRHHDQPANACATTSQHHQPGSPHADGHGEPADDSQCAATHACAAATPVIRVDAAVAAPFAARLSPPLPPAADRPVTGLRSPPFHPPKA